MVLIKFGREYYLCGSGGLPYVKTTDESGDRHLSRKNAIIRISKLN